jgi:hypothetical protein
MAVAVKSNDTGRTGLQVVAYAVADPVSAGRARAGGAAIVSVFKSGVVVSPRLKVMLQLCAVQGHVAARLGVVDVFSAEEVRGCRRGRDAAQEGQQHRDKENVGNGLHGVGSSSELLSAEGMCCL